MCTGVLMVFADRPALVAICVVFVCSFVFLMLYAWIFSIGLAGRPPLVSRCVGFFDFLRFRCYLHGSFDWFRRQATMGNYICCWLLLFLSFCFFSGYVHSLCCLVSQTGRHKLLYVCVCAFLYF